MTKAKKPTQNEITEMEIIRWSERLKIAPQRIKEWLSNFQLDELWVAKSVLEHLHLIDQEKLNNICDRLYIKILESISCAIEDLYFVSLGEPAKSDKLITYWFRKVTRFPEDRFLDILDPKLKKLESKTLIYLDDLSGSGNQFLGDLTKFQEQKSLELSTNTLIFAPLYITEEAIRNINKNTSIKIIYLEENLLSEKNYALSLKAEIFPKEKIAQVREILINYGKKLYPEGPLGYGNLGLLITFFYNTPNNTLPVIWAESNDINFQWIPLFPRSESRKANNIATLLSKTSDQKEIVLNEFKKPKEPKIKSSNEQISLKIGIFSKISIPKGENFDYSLEISKSNDQPIDWKSAEQEIFNLKKKIEDSSDKRFLEIHAKAHLTFGFLFGFIFRKTTGFALSVKQLDEIWFLTESDGRKVLKEELKKGNKKSKILIIRINIGKNDIKNPVDEYLNENRIIPLRIIDFEYDQIIKKNEFTSMISQIVEKLKINLVGIQEIHIFGSIPLGMAVFLGYNFNALPSIYLYEFDNKGRKYFQSHILEQI